MARTRITAAARLQRLLALLQWAASHPEGVAVDAVCKRFKLSAADLVREIDLAMMVGADSPHYDDMPFEAFVEDGLVFVRLFSFRRPLRLTPAEGLALVAAADTLVADPDPDHPGPLERALAKLADLFGLAPGESVDIDLDPDGGPTGRLLREAIAGDRQVRFTYWTYGRDVVAARTVDPWSLRNEAGAWYLDGFDVEVGAERRFRLDRIADPVLAEEPRTTPPPRGWTSASVASGAPQVVLELAPGARWVTEAHPVLEVEPAEEGRLRVTLEVSGSSWLERLLLRLGDEARVLEIDPALGGPDLAAAAAARVLARYRDRPPAAAR